MPPAAATAHDAGSDNVNVFAPAACVTVTDCPAMTAVPVRANALVVAPAASAIVADPVPLGGLTTIHGTVDDVVHVASDGDTVNAAVVVPPAALTDQSASAIVTIGVIPACVTVTVRPATVTVAVRGCAKSPRAAAVSVTAPVPVPEAGLTVSHDAVDDAVQARCSATMVTDTA